MEEKPVCFVISPIGKEGSEIRHRSNKVLKHVITPVADECGYKAVRADNISEAGMITTQVLLHIVNAPMVVADLTGHNANVFYELAVRHVTKKPYIQIIQKGEPIPFDVAGVRTIELDHTDLESVADAKEEIKKQMLRTVEMGEIESPVSAALDFEKLRRSDDPEKRQLADILQGMAEIKQMIQSQKTWTLYPDPINLSTHWEGAAKVLSVENGVPLFFGRGKGKMVRGPQSPGPLEPPKED
jgi:hypothetical protein